MGEDSPSENEEQRIRRAWFDIGAQAFAKTFPGYPYAYFLPAVPAWISRRRYRTTFKRRRTPKKCRGQTDHSHLQGLQLEFRCVSRQPVAQVAHGG